MRGKGVGTRLFTLKFVREATRKYKAKVNGDTVFSANVSMILDPFASVITILLVRGCICLHALVLKRLFPSSYLSYDFALNNLDEPCL